MASAVRRVRDSGVQTHCAGRGSRRARAWYIGTCATSVSGHSDTSIVPYSIARSFSATRAWRINQSPVSSIIPRC